MDLSVEFRNMPATGSGEAPNTPPSLPTTSSVKPKPLEAHGLYLALTPMENQLLLPFDGSDGNVLSIIL